MCGSHIIMTFPENREALIPKGQFTVLGLLITSACQLFYLSSPALPSHPNSLIQRVAAHPLMMDEDIIIKELCGDITHL